mmetsp:Transcript_6146/g.14809  ORF Transcript_6146/g.14809 Transcript_6146/m.14809 type:complete len:133 (+) Transcript_6146:3-401(+)
MAAGITLGRFDGEKDRLSLFVVKDEGSLMSSFMCMFKRTKNKLALDCARGTAPTEDLKDVFDRIHPRLYPNEKERKALLQSIYDGCLGLRDARVEEQTKSARDSDNMEGGEASRIDRLVYLADVQNAAKALR